jgi:hypothetical protein
MRSLFFVTCAVICMILTVSCGHNQIKLALPQELAAKLVPSPDHPGGTWIPKPEADRYITNFRNEIQDVEYPIKTEKDQNLRGFFVSREVFDSLEKNADINGYMFYFAKHDHQPKKVYTLVIVGTKMNIDNKSGTDGTACWEEIDPCPDICGTSGK